MIGAALSLLGGNPLPFLKANWKIIAIIIIVSSVGGYIYYLRNKVENQELQLTIKANEIVRLNEQLTLCKSNFDSITQAVKTASDDSKASVKAMESLALTIKKDNEKNALKYKSMLEQKAPQNCQELETYLIDSAKTFKW